MRCNALVPGEWPRADGLFAGGGRRRRIDHVDP